METLTLSLGRARRGLFDPRDRGSSEAKPICPSPLNLSRTHAPPILGRLWARLWTLSVIEISGCLAVPRGIVSNLDTRQRASHEAKNSCTIISSKSIYNRSFDLPLMPNCQIKSAQIPLLSLSTPVRIVPLLQLLDISPPSPSPCPRSFQLAHRQLP